MQKRTIQVISAAAVLFLIVLLVALIINVAQLAVQRQRLNELNAMYEQAAAYSQALDEDIAVYDSDEYIEYYARKYLYMQGAGGQAFTAKD